MVIEVILTFWKRDAAWASYLPSQLKVVPSTWSRPLCACMRASFALSVEWTIQCRAKPSGYRFFGSERFIFLVDCDVDVHCAAARRRALQR